MATSLPPKLRIPDIARFAHRAAQLETKKPVIAYWCNYWVVQQIISKGLHNTDEECKHYTGSLVDKLERTKSENTENDAIVDDIAGQAYVEQFGLEVFQRADNAVQTGKASKQTIDTFQAAATFLELNHIWGSLEPDISSKIKFAKYEAVRIAKAIKAGEDPNLSNPLRESHSVQEDPPLDPNDPEVQALSGSPGRQDTRRLRQASVEDVPDEGDRTQAALAAKSYLNQSLHPSRSSSVPRPPDLATSPAPTPPNEHIYGEQFHQTAGPGSDVSPLEPSPEAKNAYGGGDYFPQVQDIPGAHQALYQDSAPPSGLDSIDHLPRPLPADIGYYVPSPSHEKFNTSPPSATPSISRQNPIVPDPQDVHSYRSHPTSHFALHQPSSQTSYMQPSAPQPFYTTSQQAMPAQAEEMNYSVDEEAIIKAQKHARWAISALNFEDVKTAVKELKGALETLGAR